MVVGSRKLGTVLAAMEAARCGRVLFAFCAALEVSGCPRTDKFRQSSLKMSPEVSLGSLGVSGCMRVDAVNDEAHNDGLRRCMHAHAFHDESHQQCLRPRLHVHALGDESHQ